MLYVEVGTGDDNFDLRNDDDMLGMAPFLFNLRRRSPLTRPGERVSFTDRQRVRWIGEGDVEVTITVIIGRE
jgi:hypothetical protein